MKFVYRPSIKFDLLDAVDYYKSINPNLARQFLLRVKQAKNAIAQNPLHYSLKYKNVRTILLKQFPYHIHFAIIDENLIVVYAIICAFKKPTDFSNRY